MEIDSYAPIGPGVDLVTALGHLCLGSRLKRLGERMQASVALVLAEQGHDVHPAQLPILMALHREGAMTIGLLGERVGISQPGVSRAVAALEAIDLVAVDKDGRDKRQRRISITPQASARMTAFEKRFFPVVEQAVAGLCSGLRPETPAIDLLDDLAALEARMAAEPLEARIRRGLRERADG